MNICLIICIPSSRRGWRKEEKLAEDVLKMMERRTGLELEMIRRADGISIVPEGTHELSEQISSYKS